MEQLKKCTKCGKSLHPKNKSLLCARHYQLWWKSNTIKGKAIRDRSHAKHTEKVKMMKKFWEKHKNEFE